LSVTLVKEVLLMELSAWRDIIVIVWGVVATAAMVFISIILFLFYRRTISVLEATELTVARAGDIAEYLDKEVLRRANRFGTMIQGIIQGVNIVGSIFKKKKEHQDE
jgi:hypothetical protein